MSNFTPDDIRLAFAESFTLHTMEEPHLSRAYEVFDRFIAKVRADTWDDAIDFVSRHYEDYLPLNWDAKARIGSRGKR